MALADVSKVVGDRFSVTAALPSAIVVLFTVFLVRTGAFGGSPDVGRLAPAYNSLTGAGAVALVVGVVLLSLMLEPFQFGLVRLLEGYWGTSMPAGQLAALAVEVKRRRVQSLQADLVVPPTRPPDGLPLDEQLEALRDRRRFDLRARRASARLRGYPPDPGRLLPTDLGNALRRVEDTAGQRYGLQTVTVFPRLYPLLSSRLHGVDVQLRNQQDTAAGLCVAAGVVTALGAVALLTDGWWLLVPAGTLMITVISYRAAISAAHAMGMTVVVAFDLHRHDLLASLRRELPQDPVLEYVANKRLSRFLATAGERDSSAPVLLPDDYVHPAAAPAAGPQPQSSAPPQIDNAS